MRTLVAAFVLGPLAFAQAPVVQPLPEDRAAGAATIAEDDLRAWMATLTSKALGGRATGSEGFARAAELVAACFREHGLLPYGDAGTYLQRVPWSRRGADPASSGLTVKRNEQIVALLRPGDGLCGHASSSGKASGELVLLIVRTAADAAALREVDLDGKIALLLAPGLRGNARLEQELQHARLGGRVFVDDQACERQPGLSGTTEPGRGAANPAVRARDRLPSTLYTTMARLGTILHAAGKSMADADQAALLLPLGLTAELRIDVKVSDAPAFNVVGALRGSDAQRREEWVVIGSHLDHLGTTPDGRLHPGADDDASGTCGVLALAKAFAANPKKPARSVLFVTFCGEELGLIGSEYFADQPPIPLSSIAAELQLDMIGRCEESATETAADNRGSLHLIGTQKISADLHTLCVARNEAHAGFTLEWDEEDVFFRSDHFSFARKGVPIAFFFTGFHGDYHAPGDTPDKIDYAKLGRVATYVYDVAFELAQRPERPLVDAERWDALRDQLGQSLPAEPAAPLRPR